MWQTYKDQGEIEPGPFSPSISLKQKGLAQARESFRSGELPSPRRGLKKGNSGFLRSLA